MSKLPYRRLLAVLGLSMLGILAILVIPQAASSHRARGIVGQVTSADGVSVAGVTVDLYEAPADGTRGARVSSTTTGSRGTYRFGLAKGQCRIVVLTAPSGTTFVGGAASEEHRACVSGRRRSVRLTSRLTATATPPVVPAPTSTTIAPSTTLGPPATDGTTSSVPATTAPATTTSSSTASSITTPATTAPPTTPSSNPPAPDMAANLALIRANPTRNSQYDSNRFRNVPAADIAVSDLTVQGDIYDERLLDTTNSGYFRTKCEVSHFAYDDPIVWPGQPGRAHLHMFFGNTDTNAYSTYQSLLNTGTGTCNGEDLNRTAYWVPAMLDQAGNALVPYEIMVYYKNDNFRLSGANELVSPFPANLQMVIGNAKASSPQTTLSGGDGSFPVVSFVCGPAYNATAPKQALIPDCAGDGNALEMTIAFPQCYNPAAGTYLADQSHMSYSIHGYYGARCPDSHPYDVSSIMFRIFFSPADYGGRLSGLHLSSDIHGDTIMPGGTTVHADWFGAWHPGAMDMWVQNCNNTQADCEIGLLDRDPAVSMVQRKRGFYPRGYRAPAADLIKLCPGKVLDPARPLQSVASCRTS